MPASRISPEVQERIKDGHVGPYRVKSLVGAGGMGAVFRCEDPKLHREVAVKILLAPDDGRNIERFLAEARTLARLSHANVVQVHDVGYDGHVPYFVMEFVVGESLAQRLERLGRLRVDDAREVVRQVAQGLNAVHHLGLIHRDVKAANVIVASNGVAKLVDFGIARPVENAPAFTSSGLVMGTPSSMAPEQLRGEDIDQRTDVYGLGVLLYQLLTGQRPYEGDDPAALAQAQETAPPRPVRELRDGVPDDLVRVLDKALARRRDDRYWNCDELMADLAPQADRDPTRTATGVPVSTVPGGVGFESESAIMRRSGRRQGMLLAVGALLALFAAGGATRVGTRGCLVCERPVAGAEGVPASMGTAPSGVFFWHDGTGWHLRARGTDARRTVAGTVRVGGGRLSSIEPIDEPSAEALTLEGRRVARFRFDDPGTGAGFDFRVDAGCVEFELSETGGAPVRIGGGDADPGGTPARFCR